MFFTRICFIQNFVMIAAVTVLCLCFTAMAVRHEAVDPGKNTTRSTDTSGTQSEYDTISGHIVIYGSDPHTFPGIMTDDGDQYTVRASSEVLQEIIQLQGEHVLFRGTIVPRKDGTLSFQMLKDGSFFLESWEILR